MGRPKLEPSESELHEKIRTFSPETFPKHEDKP